MNKMVIIRHKNSTTSKICKFKGIDEFHHFTNGESYLLEIVEAESINPNGVWHRVIVNYLGTTRKIYKTFNEFLEDWEIVG